MIGIKSSSEQFVERSKEIHGNKYDYSNVEYINAYTPVKIICLNHGVFEQKPMVHLRGSGCKECSFHKQKHTTENFISLANIKHNFKYDYSNCVYINAKTKVKIVCPIHGEFEQLSHTHLRGSGCLKCRSEGNKTLQYDFIQKCISKHNNRYDYSLVDYKHSTAKIKIICPIHGEFTQIANCHLSGCGCPVCKLSKGEMEIKKWLDGKSINYKSNHRFKDCRNKLPLPFDFYLPDHNICIEFDGIQHFELMRRSKDIEKNIQKLKQSQRNDNIKTQYCNINNITLIRISYNESILDKLHQLPLSTCL